MSIPVLILAFNRLDQLHRCIESLPSSITQIYISVDGPRDEFPEESSKVVNYAEKLLKKNRISDLRVAEKNGGTLNGVINGIDWFFEKVDFGLVLEDDLELVPDLIDFVKRVELEFIHSNKYLSICLYSPLIQDNSIVPEAVYRETALFFSWGWCSTSEKWRKRRSTFTDIGIFQITRVLLASLPFSVAIRYLLEILKNRKQETYQLEQCNWDLYWEFTCWEKQKRNLVLNYRVIAHTAWNLDSTHQMPIPKYYKPLKKDSIPFHNIPIIKDDYKSNNLIDKIILKDIRCLSGLSSLRHLIKLRTRIRKVLLRIS